MAWWKKKASRAEERPETASDPLRERVDDLERGFRALKSEWLDTLDRLQRLHARIVKRSRVDEGEQEESPPASSPPRPPPKNGVDELDRQIALRRSRTVHPGGS